MNTTQRGGAATPLPELSEHRVDEIETSLFAEIARERTTRHRRRTSVWLVSGAAAAVIVVAAVIAPSVATLVGGSAADESASAPVAPDYGVDTGGGADSGVASDAGVTEISGADSIKSVDGASTNGRDIITTASATLVVEDVADAAATIGDAATSRGGYVESMSIGRSGEPIPVDPMMGGEVYDTMPYPYTPDGAWITVRVPADGLASLVDQLSGIGEVTASTINRQDVTEVTVDLRARVDAAQASVDRLTELMTQAGSLSDLIAAEAALAERQATLESYQQQLKYYDEQVAMSTLTVTLFEPAETVEANPAGFSDGLAAGWNGLVATLNGIVIALGFMIPWIVVIFIAGLIVWGIVRLVRRRRGSSRAAAQSTPAPPVASDSDQG